MGLGLGPFFDELERKLRKGRRRRSRYVDCHDRRGFNLAVRAVKYDREKAFALRVAGVCLVRVRLVAA